MQSSLNRYNSRYVQGGTTEQLSDKLGYWERKIFPKDSSDITVEIDGKYDRRPWMLAYDLYKDTSLTWFILQYNNIVDVEVEFVVGSVITLPTPFRLRVGLLSKG